MDVTKVMGCDEKLLILENQNVCYEIFFDGGVIVFRPYFSLLVEARRCQGIEDDLVPRLLNFACPLLFITRATT